MLLNHGVPNEGPHVLQILMLADSQRKAHGPLVEAHAQGIRLLGVSLCALYQAATCHRKCFGSGHVLESLFGRVYNHASACINLLLSGYYDESLSLTRNIGEITNLIMLSVFDKDIFHEWLHSDRRTRIRRFGPSKVRELLKQHSEVPLIANDDWYGELSESYIHVKAGLRPNMHNQKQPYAGGIMQEDGFKLGFGKLVEIVAVTAMFVCRYVDLDDLFQDLSAALKDYGEVPEG